MSGSIHEENTRKLKGDSLPSGGEKEALDLSMTDVGEEGLGQETEEDQTLLDDEELTSEHVWPQHCGERRRKYWWVLPVSVLFVLILFVAWSRRSSRSVDILSWLWVVFFLVSGVGLGGTIFFSCSGWSIHRVKKEVVSWWGVFFPLIRKKYDLQTFSYVSLAREEKARPGSFSVALVWEPSCVVDEETRLLDTPSNPEELSSQDEEEEERVVSLVPKSMTLDYPTALSGAKQIALFLGQPLLDQSTGGRVLRSVASLDESVLERWRKDKIPFKRKKAPKQTVFRRAGDSVVLGRKEREKTVWDVVFSQKTLVVGGRSFPVSQIEEMVVDDSPYEHQDGRMEKDLISGIHVFSARGSVAFCKKLSREETYFIYSILKAVFLGTAPGVVLKGVLPRK